MDFDLGGFFSFYFAEWILCLLSENFHGLLPSVVFHFHPQWIPCLLREYFHGFYLQWLSFYILLFC